MAKAHICITVETAHQHDVTLLQTGFDRFDVRYGLILSKGLNYADAARRFGECVMHALSCADRVDNRSAKEAKADGDTAPVFTPE